MIRHSEFINKLLQMLRIRLSRVGRRNQAKYRIVVAEHLRAVKGKILEIIGSYNPQSSPKELRLDKERYDYWVKEGAQPTPTMKALYEKAE